MNGRQFDDLVRDAAEPVASRRGIVFGLAGGAFALLLGSDAAAAGKRRGRGRRSHRCDVRVCFKDREIVVNRAAARELVSRGAQRGACQVQTDPGALICPIGTVPCAFASGGSTPACCGPNSICATCNPGGNCICCPAAGGSCPSCQADSFVCCSTGGACSCCAVDQACEEVTGSCTSGSGTSP